MDIGWYPAVSFKPPLFLPYIFFLPLLCISLGLISSCPALSSNLSAQHLKEPPTSQPWHTSLALHKGALSALHSPKLAELTVLSCLPCPHVFSFMRLQWIRFLPDAD